MNAKGTTKRSGTKLARLAKIKDREIVYDEDAPRTRAGDWKDAIVSHSLPELKRKLDARRKRGPGKRAAKVLLSVRYSPAVVAWFKASGAGWQARMNAALERYIRERGS